MKSPTRKFTSTALIALFISCTGIQAQTVAWGSSVSVNPLTFNSDGTVDNLAQNNQNLWTLGYFTDGFTPDQTNFLQWAANWNPVSAPTADGTGNNVPHHRLFPEDLSDPEDPFPATWSVSVNTANVSLPPGSPDAFGKQAYIFAYNDLNLIGTPQGQALLFRQDGLLLPTIPNQITFDIADNQLDTGDDNFTVIWGRVDRNLRLAGGVGVLQGGGIISSIATETVSAVGFGSAEAQFATWAPIPEPSSAILAICGVSFAVLRRRRNA